MKQTSEGGGLFIYPWGESERPWHEGGEGVDDEDAEATAGAGDFDGDGKLSWAEFYTKLAGLQ